MGASQLAILAIIGTPLLILGRDAFNRRRERRQALLALGVLLAILANVAITLYLGRASPAPTASGSYASGGSQKAASAQLYLTDNGRARPPPSRTAAASCRATQCHGQHPRPTMRHV